MIKFSSQKHANLISDLEKSGNKKTPLIEKFDKIEEPQRKSFYKVEEYDETCEGNNEENFKIEKVQCLIRDDRKFMLYALMNIFTLFLINLALNWFPKIKLVLLYQNTTLKKATHMGIYGSDKKFYIVEAYEVVLPKISNSPIFLFCKTNVHSFKTKLFTYKLYKYIYSPTKKAFLAVKFELDTTYDIINRKFMSGLNNLEKEYQKNIYGNCDLEIEIASIYNLIFEEIKDPFYIFQFFSVILWTFNDYTKYGIVIFITSIISLIIAVYEIRSNLIDIQKMANYSCDVIIYRTVNNQKKPITCKSVELVPGDLFELPEDNLVMPCDAILVSGSVMMNESMLTGESIPILKSHIPNSGDFFNKKTDSKYILFAGTKIIQKRSIKNTKVMGLVINTGFNTEKGNLVRSIVYPSKTKIKFETDSWRYILFMGGLSLLGFVISLKFMIYNGLTWKQILIKGFDLITTTVPPALPACLGIGISFALGRLKKSGISCINRQRVNLAGQVNLVCFDKTGTLTEDHLDIYGYRPINYNNGNFVFDSFTSDCTKIVDESYKFEKERDKDIICVINSSGNMLNISNISREDKIKLLRVFYVECLATCHSITKVNGKFIGDPLDIEMFRSTGWVLKESLEDKDNYDPLVLTFVRHHMEKDTKELLENLQNYTISSENIDIEEKILKSQYELGIVRRFEFTSRLQRMSVIVRNVNEENFKVYCKGSPEKIRELCREDTIPDNFSTILANYTNKGYRVLGLSCKLIKMDYLQSQKISREIVENNMIFLGFVIVQNKLKENTTEAIVKLHKAGLRLIMATGDNILTAVSVSKECMIVPSLSEVYLCEISSVNSEYYLNCEVLYKDGHGLNEEDDHSNFDDERSDYFTKNIRKISNYSKNENNIEIEIEEKRKNSKLTNNLNIVSIDEIEQEEYDSEEYDDEYNITKKKIKSKKVHNENEMDTLRIHLDNFNFSTEEYENDYIMAVTGKTFEILYKLKIKYLLTGKEQYKEYYDLFRILLSKTKIYARMSPDQKTLLIESLKEEKFIVAMCGDGANDIGALRSADVGVSLSAEEASIAAHFTSTVPEISCLIKLFREGKASLITSIECFKFMMLYSIIQFFSVTILIIVGTYLSEYQFLVVDLFLIFPLAILIARTGAYKELTYHKPTGALISLPIISSVILQSCIQFLAQFISYLVLINESWYVPLTKSSDANKVESSSENTTIFLISFVQYLITACSFTISKPFKKEIYTNYLLCIFLVLSFILSFYLILVEESILSELFIVKLR